MRLKINYCWEFSPGDLESVNLVNSVNPVNSYHLCQLFLTIVYCQPLILHATYNADLEEIERPTSRGAGKERGWEH